MRLKRRLKRKTDFYHQSTFWTIAGADRAAMQADHALGERQANAKPAALALARFFLDHRARIKDIEINPLMVRANNPARDRQSRASNPAGADPSVVAVDVRVLWREDAEGA